MAKMNYMSYLKNLKINLYFSCLIFNSILEHHLVKNIKTDSNSRYILNLIYTTFFIDDRFYSLKKEGKLIPQRLQIKPYWM